ncbi:MAG: ADP-ribosylglycohydrolase family protein [Candidatus Helarchaeota archaeon]
MNNIKNRFIGTLIGTGIGDAMGRPFEGWTRDQIESNFDRLTELLPDFFPARYPAGQYTDDTQLTIAIAESLIRSKGFDLDDLIARFVDWLSEPPIGPGYGCLSSINRLREGIPWQDAASESGGDGTAMRVSPIGLFFYKDVPKLIESARYSSLITHTHWAATASAIVVARAVAYLVKQQSIHINEFLKVLAASVEKPEFEDYATRILDLKEYLELDRKMALMELGGMGIKPPWPNPSQMGGGFISAYAMSTTLSALYCFIVSPSNFEASVNLAVMSGGDTDTCGAITGAISGAFNGIEGIPKRWIKTLVKNEYITKLAVQLYEIAHNP